MAICSPLFFFLLLTALTPLASALSQLDVLAASPDAVKLLTQLVDNKQPLLPKHATALLAAIVPTNGLTAAAERTESVLSAAPPYMAHVVREILHLIAVSATDAPRTALLLALLAPLLLGRDEARDDGGLIMWLSTHVLLAKAMHSARQLNGRTMREGTFTHVMQLPIAVIRGSELNFAEDLMEGVPIPRKDKESASSMLARVGLPLAEAILTVDGEAPREGDPPGVREPASAAAGSSRGDAPRGPDSFSSPSKRKGERDALAPPPTPAPPVSASKAAGDHMRLRVGDVILAVDGKLLTMASAQTLMAESRKGRGGMRAKMATVSVLRATSSEHACYLIEQSTQQSRTGGASAPGSSHSQEGSSHGPSPPTKSPAKSGGGKSSDGKGSSAERPSVGAPSQEAFLLKLAGANVQPAAAAPSPEEPTAAQRTLNKTASLEHLRGKFLQEARERAAREGAELLERERENIQKKAAELLDEAATEAEKVRLRKRSQTQAQAEAEILATADAQRRHELSELKRAHRAEIEMLQKEHAASVAAFSAAVGALEENQPAYAAQLQSFVEAVQTLQPPSSPSATAQSSDAPDQYEIHRLPRPTATLFPSSMPDPPSYLISAPADHERRANHAPSADEPLTAPPGDVAPSSDTVTEDAAAGTVAADVEAMATSILEGELRSLAADFDDDTQSTPSSTRASLGPTDAEQSAAEGTVTPTATPTRSTPSRAQALSLLASISEHSLRAPTTSVAVQTEPVEEFNLVLREAPSPSHAQSSSAASLRGVRRLATPRASVESLAPSTTESAIDGGVSSSEDDSHHAADGVGASARVSREADASADASASAGPLMMNAGNVRISYHPTATATAAPLCSVSALPARGSTAARHHAAHRAHRAARREARMRHADSAPTPLDVTEAGGPLASCGALPAADPAGLQIFEAPGCMLQVHTAATTAAGVTSVSAR